MRLALRLVVRAGAGYDTIDVPAASARGIYVSNCPGKNSVAVAELTFALMLALDRRIPANAADLKAGRWNKAEYSKARGLFGRTLGLVGLGRIGQEVLARAHAFGMPVAAWSRSLTPERAAALGVQPKGSPGEVAAACNVLSVHVAITDGTRNLIDSAVLGALRPGSYFINTARALGLPAALGLPLGLRRLGLLFFLPAPLAETARQGTEKTTG
jgi:D-3-phosphoglycerate dehydrogenase